MNNYLMNDTTIITAHISDLHFGAMDPKRQYDFLKDQFIDKLIQIPRLDLICINGDLFDRKFMTNSDVVMYASMFIADIVDICKNKNATFILLQGTMSHDANQVKIYLHYMYRNDIDARIVTNIRFEMVKGVRILCIPELYGIDESFYDDILFNSDFYDMCIMHGTIKGAVFGDNVGQGKLFTMNDFVNCKGPIISGHIHKPDTFYNHFYYCGSPYRWRFDDDHFKGFILMSYNTFTRMYYLDYQEIFSDNYKTITMDQLVNNDPMETVKYIRNLKATQGIDYIKIKFTKPILASNKMAINNTFRTDSTISLEFFSQEKEIARQAEEKIKEEGERFAFLLDQNLTDEQKFVMWVNYLKQDEKYLTVEELEEILKDDK
jgi:DNA repair exonuclease SbcCD nuclease subunit